jgi:hypothetical protein
MLRRLLHRLLLPITALIGWERAFPRLDFREMQGYQRSPIFRWGGAFRADDLGSLLGLPRCVLNQPRVYGRGPRLL